MWSVCQKKFLTLQPLYIFMQFISIANMKKYLVITLLLAFALTSGAVPAKRGQWTVITLDDGTQVKVELRGDEHFHFFADQEGNSYFFDADTETYRRMSSVEVGLRNHTAKMRRAAKIPAHRALKNKETSLFQGEKKGLIILVEFKNSHFAESHTLEYYHQLINEQNFSSSEGYVGSVRDYFHDQSNGQFDLSFDVVGPVPMPNDYAYYGRDSGGEGNDVRPGEMVATACKAVDDEIDFSTYDWDGDGVVEEVYVLYAGHGQADYYDRDSKVIWPHMYQLSISDYGRVLTLDGVDIDVYACSNEIQADGTPSGIGTFCHEFSHCMGFPDAYDTMSDSYYYSNYGMGSWDLMDAGSYNGNMFVPAGYSAYEKWECGWIEPVELLRDTTVTDMKTVYEGGEAYILRNQGHPDEVYILENRQKKRWDAELPASGMLIHYVDYDETLWELNCPNGWESIIKSTYGIDSDHQHLTIVHADDSDGSWDENGDTYPYKGNNTFSKTSTPAAKLWHKNTDGTEVLNIEVKNITKNADGTMAFEFRNLNEPVDPVDPIDPVDPDDEGYTVVFYESFNKCEGTGGNDNLFSGSIANYPFIPDFEGWTTLYSSKFGANKCARFGSSTKKGTVTSPDFEIEGEVELLFRAAPWAKAGTSLVLSVNGDATLSETELNMKQNGWTSYLVTLTTNDEEVTEPSELMRRAAEAKTVSITFDPEGRFFLDEVKVRKKNTEAPPVVNGILEVNTSQTVSRGIYSLDGRYVGTDFTSLRPGVYIVGKRKVVKK